MKSKTINYFKVLPLVFLALVYSCDIFAPFYSEFVDLSKNEIDFKLFENEEQFIVTYADSFDVDWEISSFPEWVEVIPLNGTINLENPDTITVKANRSKLLPGIFEEKIVINFRDKNNAKIVKVKLEIQPKLVVQNDSLNLSSADTSAKFSIINEGNYPLKWSLSSTEEWLEVQPDSGKLDIDSSKFFWKGIRKTLDNSKCDTSVEIKIDRRKLVRGINHGIVKINSEAGVDSVKISVFKKDSAKIYSGTPSLDFNDNINSKTIIIENQGEETLNWTSKITVPWITINPSSGYINNNKTKDNSLLKTSSSEIEIYVDRSGLPPGNYNSYIDLISNGGNLKIDVSMNVPEIPAVSVAPMSLDFGASDLTKKIQISNKGTGSLSWSAEATESWLTITPSKGSITDRVQDVNVNLTRLGLLPGNYACSIKITTNGGITSIPVTMSVSKSPKLKFSPSSISFNNVSKVSSIGISNEGEGNLNWQLSTNQDWINFSQQHGTVSTETDIVNISVNTSLLSPGNYSGNVHITSDFGNGNVQISLTIPETPKLDYNPSLLIFDQSKNSSTIEIINNNSIPFDWHLSSNQSWIEFSQVSGTLSQNQKYGVEVNINRTGLSPGNYSGNIIINSTNGNGNIEVKMTVKGDPKIKLSKKELTFESDVTSKAIEITNEGDENLDWSLSVDQSWINSDNSSGTIQPKKSSEIGITVDAESLPPGEHSGHINIFSNGGNESIKIAARISEKISFSVSPNKLKFRDNDLSGAIKIKNTGNGNLIWQASTDQSWLNIVNNSGTTLPKESDEIKVTINSEGMTPGEYNGIISISTNGGNEFIDVGIEIENQDEIKFSVSPEKIKFRENDLSATIKIKNNSNRDLIWQALSEQSWLIIVNKSGITTSRRSDEIIINASIEGLSQGSQNGRIFITTNGGDKIIEVELVVKSEEEIKFSVSPEKLKFSDNNLSGTIKIKNSGDGDLVWTASADQTWLNIANNSGTTSPKQSDDINVTADIEGLTPGEYNGSIVISTNGGDETIEVELVVKSEEEIKFSVSPEKLKFSDNNLSGTIKIKNSGDGDLVWTASADQAWLNIANSSGTTSPKQSDDINVTADIEGLTPGEYNGSIVISTNGGDETIVVELKIESKPILSVSEIKLEFEIDKNTVSFIIENKGSGILDWSISEIQDNWVIVSPMSGSLSNDKAIVNVTIDRSLIPSKIKKSEISINSNGGNESINILLKSR